MKNKASNLLKILIVVLIVAILLVGLSLLKKDKNEITFYLLGDKEVTLNMHDIYHEEGFVALDESGISLADKVIISGTIDNSKIGKYTITYSLILENGITKKLERIVSVLYRDDFYLIGESEIYLLVGGNYQELGAKAYFDNVDYSDKIKITHNIDPKVSGIYTVNYTLENKDKLLQRTVYINNFDDYFKVDYAPLVTNDIVSLKISTSPDKVLKYLLPNGEESRLASNIYQVTENGTYNFTIYDNFSNSITKSIEVTNIDKTPPNATCEAVVEGNNTKVTVSSSEKISKYIYNGIESSQNNYTFSSKVSNVSVTVYDEAGNARSINCASSTYSNELEMHFIATGHYDDAILIRTDDKTIFIDGGRYNCAQKVIPYLKDLGVTKIDAMIGSHIQNNHIATQSAVLENFLVDKVYYVDDIFTCASRGTCSDSDQEYIVASLRKTNKVPVVVKPGTKIEVGEMKLYFLAPSTLSSTQNENSFVFILQFRSNTFMFTGDASSDVLDVDLLNKYANQLGISLNVDMVKYPHHGNEYLSSSFLDATTPQYVVVPNYNASKYPSSDNLNRLTKRGIKVYRQSDYGNILIKSDGRQLTFATNVVASNYKR